MLAHSPFRRYGDAAVHAAAWYGHFGTLRVLTKLGADIQARNSGGGVPLYLAASGGHSDCVEFLLDEGSDINVTDEDGDTCLHDAACYNHTLVAELLLARGSSVEAQNIYGFTPLMLAAQHDSSEVVSLLLQHGADPNANNSRNGRTALHEATETRHHNAVSLLLYAGSSWELRDENGVSPYRLATRGDVPKVVSAFDKCHALHCAAERGDVDFISGAVLAGDIASNPLQWVVKLPRTDQKKLSTWAWGYVNDMRSCYVALFGDQICEALNKGAVASGSEVPSISLRDVVHDGNPQLQRSIIDFLVVRSRTARRTLRFLALEHFA